MRGITLAVFFVFVSFNAIAKGVSIQTKIATIQWELNVLCEAKPFKTSFGLGLGSVPTVNGGSKPGVNFYNKHFNCFGEEGAVQAKLKIKSTEKYKNGQTVAEEKVIGKAVITKAGEVIAKI